MLQTFKNAWKIEDLRKKIIFTAIVLVIYRLGAAIAVPFIQPEALKAMISADNGNMLGYLNLVSGGAFANATLFALGVIPYINSSIIITLLTVAIPYLENLSKEGEEGRRKIARITRYVAVGIAFIPPRQEVAEPRFLYNFNRLLFHPQKLRNAYVHKRS